MLTYVVGTIGMRTSLLERSTTSPKGSRELKTGRTPPTVVSVFLKRRLRSIIRRLVDAKRTARDLGNKGLRANMDALPSLFGSTASEGEASPFTFAKGGFRFHVIKSESSVTGPGVMLGAVITRTFTSTYSVLRGTSSFSLTMRSLVGRCLARGREVVFGKGKCSST